MDCMFNRADYQIRSCFGAPTGAPLCDRMLLLKKHARILTHCLAKSSPASTRA